MNVGYVSYLLLQIIPGLNNTIPGIEADYLPEQGAAAAAKLFEKTYENALLIFGLMVFISLAFSVISRYTSLGEEWDIVLALKRIVLIGVLLAGFKFMFGTIFITGHALSLEIFGEDNVSELNKQFEEIATREQESKGVTSDADENPISRLFTMLGQITSDIVVDTLAAIIAFIFFVATVLMHMLWRIAVIILYVMGPILIALSLFPSFGVKILSAWFGAALQVSFWQVWFAVCAFFVQTSDNTDLLKFTVGNSKAATANHIESVVFALIFTILYIATPIVVGLFLPVSSFGDGLTKALRFGGFPVAAGINTAANLASSGATGLVGVASKLFSRDGGTGSANLAKGAKAAIDKGTALDGVDASSAVRNNSGNSPVLRTNSAAKGLQERRASRFSGARTNSSSGSGGGSDSSNISDNNSNSSTIDSGDSRASVGSDAESSSKSPRSSSRSNAGRAVRNLIKNRVPRKVNNDTPPPIVT